MMESKKSPQSIESAPSDALPAKVPATDLAPTFKETSGIDISKLSAYDVMVNKGYLDLIPYTDVVIVPDRDENVIAQTFRMGQLLKLVYDKNEDNLDKLNSVFSAVYATGSALFILLDHYPTSEKDAGRTDIFLGIRTSSDKSTEEASEAEEILFSSLEGNFPGIQFQRNLDSEIRTSTLGKLLDDENRCVAAITGVPSWKRSGTDSRQFTQGLEKLVDAMGDKRYMALLLAEPINQQELLTIEKGYQDVFTQLSMMNLSGISISEQQGVSFGRSVAEGLATGLATGFAKTNSVTESKTKSLTESKFSSLNATTTASVSHTTTGTLGGTVSPSAFGFSLGSVSKSVSMGVTVGGSQSVGGTKGKSIAQTKATTKGVTKGLTASITKSLTKSLTTSAHKTHSVLKGVTCQYGMQDKCLVESLKLIDEQLGRIRMSKSFGAWEWGVYLGANDLNTARIGANIFSGIAKGESSGVERSGCSFWTPSQGEDRFKAIVKSLSQLQHPIFLLNDETHVRMTSMLSTKELTIGMSLPQKSLPGIPVLTSAEFGRSVTAESNHQGDDSRQTNIGCIHHLGTTFPNSPVSLDVDSLTGHVFITGSTGSGKSNAVYKLTDSLSEKGVRFLVIEPAKGEYKDVFGSRPEVNVFGANPSLTPLLRINPFSFPSMKSDVIRTPIHIMEHIDRLVEILNAVWPMYSAMPAILKDSVEKAYESVGWNLRTSVNRFGNDVFPDLHDLLRILPKVIQNSEYDQEVKSNYAGALLTRVRSLTKGYFRSMLQKSEIPASTLFDNDCIIDLSRIGSSETKSFLMGVLFLKLQEYRYSSGTGPNSRLKHVTVLEEAHNLLRKTSQSNNPDSSNLQGKSVEMMSNAIAEMRTFGEGFIIVDQAPGLLDPAVIRNTNTKIIFRLPDEEDRSLVGRAENLSSDQIGELARLPTGCAAIYQNNWQEAVLCQIAKYSSSFAPYRETADQDLEDGRFAASKSLLKTLLAKYKSARFKSDRQHSVSDIDREAIRLYFPTILEDLTGAVPERTVLRILDDQFVHDTLEQMHGMTDRIRWTSTLMDNLLSQEIVDTLADAEKDDFIRTVFHILSIRSEAPEQKEFFMNECDNARSWRIR